MATIGLDKLYYAKITESEDGEETYAPPVQLAKAKSPMLVTLLGMVSAVRPVHL